MARNKQKKEHWFSVKKIWQNYKTIEWLPFRTQKDGTEGILKKFGAVTTILIVSALIFAAIDALLTLVISYGGFNV